MHPEGLQKEVLRSGAQLGLAFDGDGDRLISVDEAGQIRDGDYALAISRGIWPRAGSSRAAPWSPP